MYALTYSTACAFEEWCCPLPGTLMITCQIIPSVSKASLDQIPAGIEHLPEHSNGHVKLKLQVTWVGRYSMDAVCARSTAG